MPTTRKMMQFLTIQAADQTVTSIPALEDEVAMFLNPKADSVVRELTAEEVGGILASDASGVVPVMLSDRSLCGLRLLFGGRDERVERFWAPSHVESPPVRGAIGAILRIVEPSYDSGSYGQAVVARGVATHAYIDEVT
jgi:hypothetical protein